VRQLIIELHPAAYLGRAWTVAEARDALVSDCGFTLRAARGPVYVFER
jgi:hypothetical protein